MKVGKILAADNCGKSLFHNGKLLHRAKLGIAPLILVGGLMMSNGLKGQDLNQDVVNITAEEPTEQVDTQEEKQTPWYITVPTILGLTTLITFGMIKLGNVITKHELRHWTDEDVKYWSEDHPGW